MLNMYKKNYTELIILLSTKLKKINLQTPDVDALPFR